MESLSGPSGERSGAPVKVRVHLLRSGKRRAIGCWHAASGWGIRPVFPIMRPGLNGFLCKIFELLSRDSYPVSIRIERRSPWPVWATEDVLFRVSTTALSHQILLPVGARRVCCLHPAMSLRPLI